MSPISNKLMVAAAGAGPSRVDIALVISADSTNVNIYTSATGTGNYVAGESDVTLTINSGIYVGSTSQGTYALTTGAFTTGDTVSIINNGVVIGKGGARGVINGGAGGLGGYGFNCNFATTIDNTSGAFYGGGGGGGAGGYARIGCPDAKSNCLGTVTGNGGAGGAGAGYTVTTNGSKTGGGGGTTGSANTAYNGLGGSCTMRGGAGGAGGARGVNGVAGGGGYTTGGTACCGSAHQGGGAAGSRGYYIAGGAANATWTATGTRLGLST